MRYKISQSDWWKSAKFHSTTVMAANLLRADFLSSNKKNNILIDANGFQYRKKRTLNTTSYWICRKNKKTQCSATAITLFVDGQEFIKSVKVEFMIFWLTEFKCKMLTLDDSRLIFIPLLKSYEYSLEKEQNLSRKHYFVLLFHH